jgi:reversibly glycosylated polypeptide/UDP-arabinopyranose mutase
MIAVVVPTIRPESLRQFKIEWGEQFEMHDVNLIVVEDGENPKVNGYSVRDIMGKDEDLIYNFNDGVRNLGFSYASKTKAEYIITLDDDTKPNGDTIGDHIKALNNYGMTTWVNTASDYMRGIPYNVRQESEVVLSHGVWYGVADWDAPSQLIKGNKEVIFKQGVVPKGVMYPMCGMNVAFKRKMLPYMYWAPMGPRVGLDRFADIWCGIESKKIIDDNGWAVATGYASVRHERASNVWKNLQKEAKGLEMNESYGQDEYFKLYERQRKRWQDLISRSISQSITSLII